jgi:hypothetical protein
MVKTMKIGKVSFPELRIGAGQIHKARGYFADKFREYDLIHNHRQDSDKFYYRYPAIQFKKDRGLAIVAFGAEAIAVLKQVFLAAEEVDIGGLRLDIRSRTIDVDEVSLGEDGERYVYRFTSPWLALNQKNFSEYQTLERPEDKQRKLHGILVNNIISFCKFAGYTIEKQLEVKSRFSHTEANLKGYTHTAITGQFMVNILLPDDLGLGKSSSRGYGSIVKDM